MLSKHFCSKTKQLTLNRKICWVIIWLNSDQCNCSMQFRVIHGGSLDVSKLRRKRAECSLLSCGEDQGFIAFSSFLLCKPQYARITFYKIDGSNWSGMIVLDYINWKYQYMHLIRNNWNHYMYQPDLYEGTFQFFFFITFLCISVVEASREWLRNSRESCL